MGDAGVEGGRFAVVAGGCVADDGLVVGVVLVGGAVSGATGGDGGLGTGWAGRVVAGAAPSGRLAELSTVKTVVRPAPGSATGGAEVGVGTAGRGERVGTDPGGAAPAPVAAATAAA